MCTLTYRLNATGYDVFFNRDELRTRAQAHPPKVDKRLNAIYPIDPLGGGSWLAVHQSGLCLALLNYYQAEKKSSTGEPAFISRGEIILKLLQASQKSQSYDMKTIFENLKRLPLRRYQAFQLCVFPVGFTVFNGDFNCFIWDGERLSEQQPSLPITSSGVDYPQVYEARKATFQQIVASNEPSNEPLCQAFNQGTNEQLLQFHQSQQADGKLSVKMFREDAQTVSLSHISICDQIVFHYNDYLDDTIHCSELNRYI